MRIGLVIPAVPTYSETFFKNKIKGLESYGHTVIVFANSDSDNFLQNTKVKVAPKLSGNRIQNALISIWNLFYALLFNFNRTMRLIRLDKKDGIGLSQRLKNIISNTHILSEKVDWLHFGFGTMALKRENLAKAIGAKMAVSFRGFDIGIYPLKNPGCYADLWKKVDKIHVISDDLHNLLYKQGFEGQVEVTKITPAIDMDFFKSDVERPFDQYEFVTVARLHWKKGLEDTLQALALLKDKGISFQYRIIGEGVEYERLMFAIHQFDLQENVTFLGKIEHNEIKRELQKADIYLQYSIQEGFCNAVLEAQAMGLLCVVSDAEGLAENVKHKESGWVVPKMKPQLLCEQLTRIIAMGIEEKRLISVNAMNRVKETFSLKKQQKEFIHFYGE